jgi:uncharacterized repeat protein (TIGR03837 family)
MGRENMTIDLLCKVVDNYGDIGVVYRLARALSELPEAPRLRLHVSDLAAFAALDPLVHPGADYQTVHGWEVFSWRPPQTEAARESFVERPPRFVIECFACGRPDWLETTLFDPVAGKSLIIDLEHLTAEAYAEEFHRMPSLTRSSSVRKAMFLPGFAAGTGGLVIDRSFAASRDRASSEKGRAELRRELLARSGATGASGPAAAPSGAAALRGASLPEDAVGRFWVSVFSYERDYSRIVADLAAFARDCLRGEGRGLLAIVAAGKSRGCFLKAWARAGEPFPALELPFLPQEAWDEVLLSSDFSIVRGEDSWARAALSGRPFLWQAYPQEDRYQMVKVRAFLDRLRPYFTPLDFAALEELFLAFNDRDRDEDGTMGEELLLPVLARYSGLLPGFAAFAEHIAANGDLAWHLLTFLGEML